MAMIDDVQEPNYDVNHHFVACALTAAQAIDLVSRSTKILAVVAIAPGAGWHFEISKSVALRRLRALRPDTRVMCDLENDGWCWIGTSVT